MGCDYYVDTFLYVYYNNTDYPPTYINLSHDKRYIFLSDDTDDTGEDSYNNLKEKQLNYNGKPIVIYSNKTFNEPRFEDSYKHII